MRGDLFQSKLLTRGDILSPLLYFSDFMFLLLNNLKLNMDVKFPLDNYLKYLETQSEVDKAKYRTAFLNNAKARVKEVTTREYINPDDNTVDCVLLFIPMNRSMLLFMNRIARS